MSPEQLQRYNEGMNKGLRDKLFFLDHINSFDVLVDFGTADGSLIKAVIPYEPEAFYIGYDISPSMIAKAREVVSGPNVELTSDWREVYDAVRDKREGGAISVLVLNSVLHEVFSYSSPDEYEKFWEQALDTGFDYICLRDMMTTERDQATPISSKEEEVLELMMEESEKKVLDFEKFHGEIESISDLVHLMLKWDYDHNWNREVEEDYFGVTVEEFRARVRGYKTVYKRSYVLPFLRDKWKTKWSYDTKASTHVQIVLKRS
jgi:SAM-dependent methyltransferase